MIAPKQLNNLSNWEEAVEFVKKNPDAVSASFRHFVHLTSFGKREKLYFALGIILTTGLALSVLFLTTIGPCRLEQIFKTGNFSSRAHAIMSIVSTNILFSSPLILVLFGLGYTFYQQRKIQQDTDLTLLKKFAAEPAETLEAEKKRMKRAPVPVMIFI